MNPKIIQIVISYHALWISWGFSLFGFAFLAYVIYEHREKITKREKWKKKQVYKVTNYEGHKLWQMLATEYALESKTAT